jgi:hypothetical protein
MKGRSGATDHALYDTARGATKDLVSNSAGIETTQSTGLTAFTASGFTVGALAKINTNANTYVSWTFRKQPKFFDVVTYTGNGSNRTIAHSLGSVPGCIIVKRTDTSANWQVYHRSLANTEYMVLNSVAAKATGATRWNSTTPTSTEFSLGTDTTVNASGGTYVAYLFAHDAGGFGASGTDNVISCGSFTTNGSGNATVTLGYEPQWLILKATSNSSAWDMFDNMRGMPVGTADSFLSANASSAEALSSNYIDPTATGFNVSNYGASYTWVYIAIRRGPMRTPTTGTSVYEDIARTGTSATASVGSLPTVDAVMVNRRQADGSGRVLVDRLRGSRVLRSSSTAAEVDYTGYVLFDQSAGVGLNSDPAGMTVNQSFGSYSQYHFRRAPGFFDVVCYTGTGSATTFSHNLGVVPELMIVKKRSASDDWAVYANNDNTDFLLLNTTAATADDNTYWNDTSPTASVFTVGTNADVNTSAATYVAYLFATVAGVSKVGSYTGTGTTLQVNCGFTGGSRFVMVKRTDSTGDWYVWDSARGIVAGNDPYLLLNSTAAEVTGTDYVDTFSSGFEISSTAPAAINANGGTFIFLAIA